MNTTTIKRRSFLIGSGTLAAGGLAIGLPAFMAGEALAATPVGMGFGAKLYSFCHTDEMDLASIDRDID